MELGVMQGRLTEKGGFYPQIFPWLEWEEEFLLAKELGVTHIEWMLNADRLPDNPILTREGRARIRELEEQTGVQVRSLCMNFIMQYSLKKKDTFDTVLNCLCQIGELGNLRMVVFPLEGNSSQDVYSDKFLRDCFFRFRETNGKIRCLIESSTNIEKQVELIEKCNEAAGICYDVGNAAGLGRNVLKDFEMLVGFVDEIHLKDKTREEPMSNGEDPKSTYFGEGVVDFSRFFSILKKFDYHGSLVLESYFKNAMIDLQRNMSYLRSL